MKNNNFTASWVQSPNLWTKECSDDNCPSAAKLQWKNEGSGNYILRATWNDKLENGPTSSSEAQEAILSLLHKLYQADSKAFCAYMQLDPRKLHRSDLIRTYRARRLGDQITCSSCNCTITLNGYDEAGARLNPDMISDLVFDQWLFIRNGKVSHGDWVRLLAPDSTGLSQDLELKHITWCDDVTCSTSEEALNLSILLGGGHHVMNTLNKSLYREFKARIADDVRYRANALRYWYNEHTEIGRRENLWEERRA